MNEKPIKKMLVIIAKGTFNEVYQGLVLANGALMEGIKAEVFFTFDGLMAIRKSGADGLKPDEQMATAMSEQNLPPVNEFISTIKESGGKIYGCKLSMDMMKVAREDLRDDVDGVISVGEFYERAEPDSQVVFI